MKEEVKCYPYHPSTFVVLDDRSKMMIVRITMMVTVVIAE
jgi:hypothetical protein